MLVIIGLIVGGVLVGQDLIQGAKVRSQITQLQNYETAINTFKLKYGGIPGDLEEPEQFWPSLTASTSRSVLGNGRIDYRTNFVLRSDREIPDVFWQLSEAGLVGGTFDGSGTAASYPNSKLNDSVKIVPAGQCCGVTQSQLTTSESDLLYSMAFYVTYVDFAGGGQGVLTGTDSGILPETMFNIDSKIDDGIARKGKVKAYTLRGNPSDGCLDGNDGNYVVTRPIKACTLEYIALR